MANNFDLKDFVNIGEESYLISTVDLYFAIDGCPYETMIFSYGKQKKSVYCRRYKTTREAIAGHNEVLDAMRKGSKIWEPL